MKGYAKPLHEFIEGHKIQFVIPVYQRNYDWLMDNCNQLFNDLVKLVMERYTDIVDTLYDAEGFFWSAKQADTRYCTMIAPQKYVYLGDTKQLLFQMDLSKHFVLLNGEPKTLHRHHTKSIF